MYETNYQRQPMERLFRNPHKLIRPFTVHWNRRDYLIEHACHIRSYQKGATFFGVLSATNGTESFEVTLPNETAQLLLEQSSGGALCCRRRVGHA